MRTHITAIAALVAAGALTLNAQTPQTPQTPQPQQRPTDARPGDTMRAAQAGQTVTITGCLKEEKDVPGQRPSVAERAGMGNDFVLTNVKMAQSSATSGIGLATMYEVEGVDDSELKKHINHQVEITGKLEGGARSTGATGAAGAAGAGAAGAAGASASAGAGGDLPKIEATNVKMVSATCPAQ